MLEFDLGPSEQMRVDTGCIVSMAESVRYDIQCPSPGGDPQTAGALRNIWRWRSCGN